MSRATVLIIDDDPDQHTVCGAFLQHCGYAVLHAFDGEQGVAMAQARRPDVVLMDIRMPRMDGVTARRALAADPATAPIPVVALSADVLTWPEGRVMAEGFAAHLPKPCNLERIASLVGRLVQQDPAAPGMHAGSAVAV